MKEIKYDLEFCFKGNRTYVHGTDIYNKIVEILNNDMKDTKIDLSFHGVAKKNILLSNKKPEDENLIKFVCKYTGENNERKILYGMERNHNITCQYTYPEEEICQLSDLDLENKEINLNKDTSYSFIENSVALNKYLLENLFPDVNGKWYFTRLQLLDVTTKKTYPLKLVLKANFNFKLTKTEIFISDKSMGYIYFSLVKEGQ